MKFFFSFYEESEPCFFERGIWPFLPRGNVQVLKPPSGQIFFLWKQRWTRVPNTGGGSKIFSKKIEKGVHDVIKKIKRICSLLDLYWQVFWIFSCFKLSKTTPSVDVGFKDFFGLVWCSENVNYSQKG